jgi:uncharacterized RDD family membrane protein YckC
VTRRLAHATAALAAIMLAVGSCPAGEPRFLLAGSDSAVWLVRTDDAKGTFDIALREKGGNWKWLFQQLTGRPNQAVAGTQKLCVLFVSPLEELVFDESGSQAPALMPQDPLWPASAAPLAMCQWQEAGSGQFVGIAAVVPRPPGPTTAPSPATASAAAAIPELRLRPATQPARGERTVTLGIFRRLGANWTHLADLPDVTIGDSSRVLATTAMGRLYLMISEPPRWPNRMLEWADGQWRTIPLAGALAEDAPLAMATIAKRVVVTLAGGADQAGCREIKLAEMATAAAGYSVQKMLLGDKPFTFRVGTLPEITRMGDQLAMLWQDANGLAFGTCQPRLGQLVPAGAVDVFNHAPESDAAQDLLATITWIIVVGIFVITMLYRPQGAAEPFILPAGARPGNIGKRLLALLIDLVPCSLLTSLAWEAWLLGTKAMSEAQLTDMVQRAVRAVQDDKRPGFPIEVAILGIAVMATFVIYCLVMEARYGATLGKMILKLRVVGNGGRRADLRQCVIRNLMKILELSVMPPLMMLILVSMVMIVTRYNQRFGDLLARTAVIDAASLPLGGLPPRPTETGDNQLAWPGSSPPPLPPPLPPKPPKPDKDDESDAS